jgi:hypothetical protein
MLGLHGVADEVLGGWRLTGIYQIHSGLPLTVTASDNGVDNSGAESTQCSCGYGWFANVVGNPGFRTATTGQSYNPLAFAVPASGTFGDETRNSWIGPNWRDLDLSLGKTFQIYENLHLEIRADSFNAFNHPNFSAPPSTIGPGITSSLTNPNALIPNATAITSTAAGNRDIQLGGRFTF